MYLLKKYTVVIAVLFALGLGVGINYWTRIENVPFCLQSPGCRDENLGTLATKKYGYPVTYKSVVSFEPNDASSYAIVSVETKSISWTNIVINTIFWYALIALGMNVYKSQTKKR